MRTVTWNPEVYGRYSGERSRPFVVVILLAVSWQELFRQLNCSELLSFRPRLERR